MQSVKIEDLKNVLALKDLPEEHLQWLLDHSDYKEYKDGDIIGKYGEPDGWFADNTFWKLKREPFMCETSVPGIFASGDVRWNALTGISFAVGEGAMAIRFVRKYLQDI